MEQWPCLKDASVSCVGASLNNARHVMKVPHHLNSQRVRFIIVTTKTINKYVPSLFLVALFLKVRVVIN